MKKSKLWYKRLLPLLLMLAMVAQSILASVYPVSAADDSISGTYSGPVEVTEAEPNESGEMTSPALFSFPLTRAGGRDRSAAFKIDTLTIKIANNTAYEYNGTTETNNDITLNLTGDPRVDFSMTWSQINPEQDDFSEGDYILFKLCEVTGSDTAKWANLTSDKALYVGAAHLATGSLVTEQTDTDTIALYYKVTFTEIVEDYYGITGNMTGGANIAGLDDDDIIKILHEGSATAEIAEITKAPNTSTGTASGSGILPEYPWLTTSKFTSSSSNPVWWQINVYEFLKKSYVDYANGASPVYADLILEDTLDMHQTFYTTALGEIRTLGLLYDTETGKTYWGDGDRFGLTFKVLQEKGLIEFVNGAADDAEAYVRTTPRSYTIITEPDGRERLILNLGAPGSTGLRYGDLVNGTSNDMAKRVEKYRTEYLRFTAIITQFEDVVSSETEEFTWTDSKGAEYIYTLNQCRTWQRIYYFTYNFYNVTDESGKVVGPYIYGYEVCVQTSVKTTQIETIMASQVTNSYKLSGGFTDTSGSGTKTNFWSGGISATRRAGSGEAQIFKADSLYGYTLDYILTNSPTSGMIGNVQFAVYKSDNTGPLSFDYITTAGENFGKYVYNTAGAGEYDTVTTYGGDGSIILYGLSEGDYYLKEVASPSGYYTALNKKIEFTISSSAAANILVTNEARGVTLKKVIAGTNTALQNATFELYSYTKPDYSDAVKVTGFTRKYISGSGNYLVYNGSGSDRLTTEINGKLYIVQLPAGKYYLQEVTAPTGYALSNEKHPFELTDEKGEKAIIDLGNIENNKVTSQTVTKIWNDGNNQDRLRPTWTGVEVQLYANNTPLGDPVKLYAGNNWTYTWNNLPLKDGGVEITYGVREVDVPEGYEAEYEDNATSTVITNSHTPLTVDVEGTKRWEDNDDQYGKRPSSIIVNLYGGNDLIDSKEVSEADGWSYSWTGLPKNEKGVEIKYTITEDPVDEYETTYSNDSYDITNTYVPDKLSVEGSDPDPTPEPTPKPDPTPTPSSESTPEPSEDPTPEPSEEPTPEPSEDPTPEPSEEPTPTPDIVLPDGYEDYEGGERIPLGKDNPNNEGLTAIQNTKDPNEYLIIDEDMVPLGTITVPEGMYIDEIDVLDNLIPLGTFVTPIPERDNPKTGDSLAATLLAAAALVGALIMLLYLRKRMA